MGIGGIVPEGDGLAEGNLRGRVLMNLRADWRAVMRSLTDGDPSLSDALFDKLS